MGSAAQHETWGSEGSGGFGGGVIKASGGTLGASPAMDHETCLPVSLSSDE